MFTMYPTTETLVKSTVLFYKETSPSCISPSTCSCSFSRTVLYLYLSKNSDTYLPRNVQYMCLFSTKKSPLVVSFQETSRLMLYQFVSWGFERKSAVDYTLSSPSHLFSLPFLPPPISSPSSLLSPFPFPLPSLSPLSSPPSPFLSPLSLLPRFHKEQEKRKHHEQLKHPASKEQLEEVWRADDGMTEEEFRPKTFFMMHGKTRCLRSQLGLGLMGGALLGGTLGPWLLRYEFKCLSFTFSKASVEMERCYQLETYHPCFLQSSESQWRKCKMTLNL